MTGRCIPIGLAALLTLACGRGERSHDALPLPARVAPSQEGSGDLLRVVLQMTPTPVRPKRPVEISFSVRTSDGSPADLDTIAGSPLHLIAVSRDLMWSADRHPDVRSDGVVRDDADVPFEWGVRFILSTPTGR